MVNIWWTLQDTKKLVYHSHIAGHIQYGLLLWGNNANKDQITKLQKLQTKCLQLVQSNQTKSNPNRDFGFLTIDEMISLENMKFGYKLVHQILPQKIAEICNVDRTDQSLSKSHQYSTRNKSVPNLPRNMNKLYRESFLCKVHRVGWHYLWKQEKNITLKPSSKNVRKIYYLINIWPDLWKQLSTLNVIISGNII